MKIGKVLSLLVTLALLFVAVVPASAQLGDTDGASFTIQNVDSASGEITVLFIDSTDGSTIIPSVLNSGKTNPFTLDPGQSWEVVMKMIPDTEIGPGSYSVVIQSTVKVVAIANLKGSGTTTFNGSYSGFDKGSTPFYLPAVVYNFYGWYSLISVMNLGDVATTATVTIKCNAAAYEGSSAVGTLVATDLQPKAAKTFVLKTQVPTGFTTATTCNGSATITTNNAQPVVAVDNQSIPTAGNTQSYSGFTATDAAPTVFVPALYYSYYGWNSSLNIRIVGSGSTTVTVTYSNGGTNTCNLSDSAPSCLLVMKNVHTVQGTFGAKITTSPELPIVAIANAKNALQAQTYNGVSFGSTDVGIPAVYDTYYGWNSSFTCQNVGTVDTKINISYEGYTAQAYDSVITLSAATNQTLEVKQVSESFLPAGYRGAVTISALTPGAEIACITNYKNPPNISVYPGDWSTSNNAFAK